MSEVDYTKTDYSVPAPGVTKAGEPEKFPEISELKAEAKGEADTSAKPNSDLGAGWPVRLIAKWLTIGAGLVVLVGIILMTTFALQTPPFAPKPIESCEIVDRASEHVGNLEDSKVEEFKQAADRNKLNIEAEKFNAYLVNKGIQKILLICDIEREIVWYGRNAMTNQVLSSIGVVLVIIFTLATSFILGAGWIESAPSLKAVTIALPLISTALTAVMSEFHMSDTWQLREAGRIEAKIMLASALSLDLTDQNFNEEATAIRGNLAKLERSQAQRFFFNRFQATDMDNDKNEGERSLGDDSAPAINETQAKPKTVE